MTHKTRQGRARPSKTCKHTVLHIVTDFSPALQATKGGTGGPSAWAASTTAEELELDEDDEALSEELSLLLEELSELLVFELATRTATLLSNTFQLLSTFPIWRLGISGLLSSPVAKEL